MNAHFLLLFLTTIFISYVWYIWAIYGVQKSISYSFYRLKGWKKILFTLFCWGFGFPLAMLADGDPLLFFAGAAFCFVGAANDFKGNELTHNVHMIGAYTGVAMAKIGLWIYYGWWYSFASFVAIAIPLLFVKNKIWWIELAAFGTVGTSLYMLMW
ncbi:MAG: hypothetical protein ACOC1K_01625 [Nanoarchaeota archaeon]